MSWQGDPERGCALLMIAACLALAMFTGWLLWLSLTASRLPWE